MKTRALWIEPVSFCQRSKAKDIAESPTGGNAQKIIPLPIIFSPKFAKQSTKP
jgi:hypothetical protein